jgi:hypothetical protein
MHKLGASRRLGFRAGLLGGVGSEAGCAAEVDSFLGAIPLSLQRHPSVAVAPFLHRRWRRPGIMRERKE